MANKKISDLIAAGAAVGTDLVEIETNAGASRKQTLSAIWSYFSSLLGTASTLTSDTDTTLAANSDTKIATQKAVKAYVDANAGARNVSFQIVGTTPSANEVLLAWTPASGETVTFADDFAGSTAKAATTSTNPASTYSMPVEKNGSTVGSISISSGGVVTFATTGTTVEIIGGTDLLEVVGNATPDTAVGFTFTLKGSL